MPDMLLYIIYLDSCAFWPPQEDEKLAMEELWKLDESGIIQLEIGEASTEEMQKAPSKLQNRVDSRIFSSDMIGTQQERMKLIEISKMLFPQKQILDDGDKRDVRNLFCAQKYGCCMFITLDKKHILSKAELIKEQLRMDVVSPKQCLKVLLNRIE